MQLINVDSKIKAAIQVIGSFQNYLDEIISGTFDEEFSCLFFKKTFNRIPITIKEIEQDIIKNLILDLKKKCNSNILKEIKLLDNKKNENIIESFRLMNKKSSLGTISDISTLTGFSKKYVRKLKNENRLFELINVYYPDYITFIEFQKVLNKVELIIESKINIESIGIFSDTNEVSILFKSLYHTYFNEQDFIKTDGLLFNKYKDAILSINLLDYKNE